MKHSVANKILESLELDAETIEGLALAREILKLYKEDPAKTKSELSFNKEKSAFEIAKNINPFLSETSYRLVSYFP